MNTIERPIEHPIGRTIGIQFESEDDLPSLEAAEIARTTLKPLAMWVLEEYFAKFMRADHLLTTTAVTNHAIPLGVAVDGTFCVYSDDNILEVRVTFRPVHLSVDEPAFMVASTLAAIYGYAVGIPDDAIAAFAVHDAVAALWKEWVTATTNNLARAGLPTYIALPETI